MKVNIVAGRGVWSVDLASDQQQILSAGFSHTRSRWNASVLPTAFSFDHPNCVRCGKKMSKSEWCQTTEALSTHLKSKRRLPFLKCAVNGMQWALVYLISHPRQLHLDLRLHRKPTRNAGGSEIQIVWCTFIASSYNVCLLRAKVSVLVAKVKPGAVVCFPRLTDLFLLFQRKWAGQYVICKRNSG